MKNERRTFATGRSNILFGFTSDLVRRFAKAARRT